MVLLQITFVAAKAVHVKSVNLRRVKKKERIFSMLKTWDDQISEFLAKGRPYISETCKSNISKRSLLRLIYDIQQLARIIRDEIDLLTTAEQESKKWFINVSLAKEDINSLEAMEVGLTTVVKSLPEKKNDSSKNDSIYIYK